MPVRPAQAVTRSSFQDMFGNHWEHMFQEVSATFYSGSKFLKHYNWIKQPKIPFPLNYLQNTKCKVDCWSIARDPLWRTVRCVCFGRGTIAISLQVKSPRAPQAKRSWLNSYIEKKKESPTRSWPYISKMLLAVNWLFQIIAFEFVNPLSIFTLKIKIDQESDIEF